MRYTPEQTEYIVNRYKQFETYEDKNLEVTRLAKELDVSKQSIITKLVLEGVYQKKQRYSKVTKGVPRKKDAIVQDLEELTGLYLEGLENAPKRVLLELEKFIEEM